MGFWNKNYLIYAIPITCNTNSLFVCQLNLIQNSTYVYTSRIFHEIEKKSNLMYMKNSLPGVWLECNEVKAEAPILDEEFDLIDDDAFLFDGLSVDGEDGLIKPTDAFTFCTCSILL